MPIFIALDCNTLLATDFIIAAPYRRLEVCGRCRFPKRINKIFKKHHLCLAYTNNLDVPMSDVPNNTNYITSDRSQCPKVQLRLGKSDIWEGNANGSCAHELTAKK